MADLKFEILTLAEFEKWLIAQPVNRVVDRIQNHHTWIPSYVHFNGRNHLKLIEGMHNFHAGLGWGMIGQHFTTFEDGKIGTGRPLNNTPTCIAGSNQGAICIEHLGNFDIAEDRMTDAHRNTIVAMNALLCLKFNLFASIESIVYHHWYKPKDGKFIGNNTNEQKTCPGTNFFGGNTLEAAQANFIPPIREKIKAFNMPARAKIDTSGAQQGLVISTSPLNVRTQANAESAVKDSLGSGILIWIYEKKNGWYKVDRLRERWVNGKFIKLLPTMTAAPKGFADANAAVDLTPLPHLPNLTVVRMTDADILNLYFDDDFS